MDITLIIIWEIGEIPHFDSIRLIGFPQISKDLSGKKVRMSD